jgi:hypothetical protein
MSFDVRAIKQLDYNAELEKLRAVAGQRNSGEAVARHDFA